MLRETVTRTVLAAVLVVAAPGAVSAQGGDGFLFREPRVTIGFEAGYGFQFAQGDFFDSVVDEFIIDRRDFDSPYVGAELGIRLDEQWDFALGVGVQRSSTLTEYWDWWGTDNLPIEQATELRLIPAVASAKYYLRPRGRSIGRFAWIPETVVPYVGAGIGVMSYRFKQTGEFVDQTGEFVDPGTREIYADELVSANQAFLARASAGVDVTVGQQFVLSGEARYTYSRAPVRGSYGHFGDIDLDGIQLVAGLGIRF